MENISCFYFLKEKSFSIGACCFTYYALGMVVYKTFFWSGLKTGFNGVGRLIYVFTRKVNSSLSDKLSIFPFSRCRKGLNPMYRLVVHFVENFLRKEKSVGSLQLHCLLPSSNILKLYDLGLC